MNNANRPAVGPGKSGRIGTIDLARGIALLAMAVYHFTWDLEFFGYAEPGLSQQGGWKFFARGIASSFLFLVGVSLVLAHGNAIRWKGFGKRLVQIAAAAAAITLITWFATPERFIFFGILHQIALASLICLVFLRAPVWVTVIVAVAIIAAPHFLRGDAFSHPLTWWVGLAPTVPLSNDYVPMFPWTGAALLGVASGGVMRDCGVFDRLKSFHPSGWASPIGFFGRHGLIFYLAHQPVLIACLWLFAQIWPAETRISEHGFMNACEKSRLAGESGVNCQAYCVRVLDAIDNAGGLDAALASEADDVPQREPTMIAGRFFRSRPGSG